MRSGKLGVMYRLIYRATTGALQRVPLGSGKLATSIAGLAWSVQLIVIGLCFVLPWALILWAGWRWLKRRHSVAGPDVARATSP